MPQQDHNQRFKILIRETIRQFFELFLPKYAHLFDFEGATWLEQEVFPDPPQGLRRTLDLICRLTLKEPLATAQGTIEPEMLVIIHIEIEASDSVEPLRQRMHLYHSHLRQKFSEPILPIALYLRVGLDGVGVDSFVERFGDLEVLRYNYLYVGLPALDAGDYLQAPQPLGATLSALMRVPSDHKAQHKAAALRKAIQSAENDYRKFLYVECIQTYLPLSEIAERDEFERLIKTEPYSEVQVMATTWFEEGLEMGMEKGERAMVERAMVIRFGPITEELRGRLNEWPADRLGELLEVVINAKSIDELPLADAGEF